MSAPEDAAWCVCICGKFFELEDGNPVRVAVMFGGCAPLVSMQINIRSCPSETQNCRQALLAN